MSRTKSTAERGLFKQYINSALYKSDAIKKLLLGDTTEKSADEIRKLFKEHVKSHLFIDDTIEKTDSFIYYDVRMLYMRENVKNCEVILYVICHRDILDDYSQEGYYGNRADILSQMVENCLVNDEDISKKFGIGKLSLDSVDFYNSYRFYGCMMTFSAPNFR